MIENNITDIVWVQTAHLGDIVLTTASFALLRQQDPTIKQHLITTEQGFEALKETDLLNSIIVFDKKSKNIFRQFSRVKAKVTTRLSNPHKTIIIQPHLSFRSTLLSKFLGFRLITFQETRLAFLADMRLPRIGVFHEVYRIGLLLTALGIKREEIFTMRPVLKKSGDQTIVSEIVKKINFQQYKFIGIAPGSKWGTKCWPIDKYLALCKKLLEHQELAFVILGSKQEQTLAQVIEKSLAIRTNRVFNLAGKTSLADLRAIFPKLTLLICNDSSPVHFASAFNIPTIAIFGSTISQMGFGPLADRSVVIETNLECRPCSDHGPMVCPLKHFKCMKLVEVERVYQEVLRITSNAKGS